MILVFLTLVTAICAGYLCYSIRDGIPESLSATYYALGKNGWWFQAVMFATGGLLLPVWLEVSEDGHQWQAFLSSASLWFVASAPAFKLELEGKIHYGSAIVCCICAVMWQITERLWDLTLLFGFFGLMLSLQWKEKWCWWMEVAVIGSLIANLWRTI